MAGMNRLFHNAKSSNVYQQTVKHSLYYQIIIVIKKGGDFSDA